MPQPVLTTEAAIAVLLERSAHIQAAVEKMESHMAVMNGRIAKGEVAEATISGRMDKLEALDARKAGGTWGGGLGAVTGGLVVAVGKLLGL